MARGLLLPTNEGYRLLYEAAEKLCAADIPAADAEPIETTVTRRLGELLPNAELVVAPLPSQAFAVRLPGGVTTKSLAALTYAVEEHVPWSAEELTAQLVHPGDPALALAVRTADWQPLLHALRAAGHTVETLVPAAVLRLCGLRHGRSIAPAETWLLQDQVGTHAFQLERDALSGWRFWPAAASDPDDRETATLMAAELRLLEPTGPLITGGISPHFVKSLQSTGRQIEFVDSNPTDDAWLWQGASSIRRGRRSGSVNLALAGLASATPQMALRAATKQLFFCAALLMLVAAGGLWWRSEQWRAMEDEVRSQQVALFQQTFPGVAVPEAIAARLRSEHRRIVGERGGEQIPELPQSVLPALAAALTAHEAPFRSRFEELAFNGAALEVECEFRSHEEAVQICERLRQSGVDLDSPQIHKLDETRVGARLRGRMAVETKPKGKQP